MKVTNTSITSLLLLIFTIIALQCSAFTPSSLPTINGQRQNVAINGMESTTKLNFFGQAKDDGSPGDYVCKVSIVLCVDEIRCLTRFTLTCSLSPFVLHCLHTILLFTILSVNATIKDCGYVFTKGPEAWSKLDDKYKCPPCGAPKFRFKKVPKGSESGKVEVKKNWFGK